MVQLKYFQNLNKYIMLANEQLKRENSTGLRLNEKKKKAGWDEEYLLKVITS